MGQFNSVKNSVKDAVKYYAAKTRRRRVRKLYMIYEKWTIPHAAVGTDACGFFDFVGKVRSGLLLCDRGKSSC